MAKSVNRWDTEVVLDQNIAHYEGEAPVASIVTLTNGRLVAAWSRSHEVPQPGGWNRTTYDTYIQELHADGTPLGEAFKLTSSFLPASPHTMVALQNGGFAVAWVNRDGNKRMNIREFDANLQPIGSQGSWFDFPDNEDVYKPTISAEESGYRVSWGQLGQQSQHVYMGHGQVEGQVQSGGTTLHGYAAASNESVTIELSYRMPNFGEEDLYLTVRNNYNFGVSYSVKLADAATAPGFEGQFTIKNIARPGIEGFGEPHFAAVYAVRGGMGSVYMKLYNLVGEEMASLDLGGFANGGFYDVVRLPNGTIAAAFSTGGQVWIKTFSLTATGVWEAEYQSFSVALPEGTQFSLSSLGDGRFGLTYSKNKHAVTDIFDPRVEPNQGIMVSGTDGKDILPGTSADDMVGGLEGDDRLYGGAGKDRLSGDGGQDFMRGGDGNDTLYGGAGVDTLEGEDGNDILQGRNLTSDSAGDSFVGGAGEDLMIGGTGADTFVGGSGWDTVSYHLSAQRIVLDMETGVVDGGEVPRPADEGDVRGDVLHHGRLVDGQYIYDDRIEIIASTEHNDILRGDAIQNWFQGRGGNDHLDGRVGNDFLQGQDGSDTLVGGYGEVGGANLKDTLDGGEGIDYASYETSDPSAGIKIRMPGTNGQGTGPVTDASPALIGEEYRSIEGVIGTTGNDSITGNDYDNYLRGNGGTDILTGGEGNDTFFVDDTSDIVVEGEGTNSASDRIVVTGAALSSYSLSTASNLYVEQLEVDATTRQQGLHLIGSNIIQNTIKGGSGADTLDGGGSDNQVDLLQGNGLTNANGQPLGGSSDTYDIYDTNDIIVESESDALSASDRVRILAEGFDYTLAADADIEIIQIGEKADTSSNLITGTITGNELKQQIYGSSKENTLDGGGGGDSLYGGAGNDTYIVSYAEGSPNGVTETIVDSEGALDVVLVGDDFDRSKQDQEERLFRLQEGAAIEALKLQDPTNEDSSYEFHGNEASNLLEGGAGDDILGGGSAGRDTLRGGSGNDSYYVNRLNVPNNSVEIVEEGQDAADRIIVAGGTFNLPSLEFDLMGAANIEILDASEANGQLTLKGNHSANTIIGNVDSNIIHGSTDGGKNLVDVLIGGGGNDVYYVDDANDRVEEGAGQGDEDELILRIGTTFYTLDDKARVERVRIESDTINTLTGNRWAQALIGNSKDNVLDGSGIELERDSGSTRVDTLMGGDGNDTYRIRDSKDFISEKAGDGHDTAEIYAASRFKLEKGASVEVVKVMTGSNHEVVGNEIAQHIIGAGGLDTIEGGGGQDTLEGKGGGDVYRITGPGQVIVEEQGGGLDTVFITGGNFTRYDLTTNLENLIGFETTGKVTLVGNAGDNIIVGNGRDAIDHDGDGDPNDSDELALDADIFVGGAGNDTISVKTSFDLVYEDTLQSGGEADEVLVEAQTYRLQHLSGVEKLTAVSRATPFDGGKGYYLVGNRSTKTVTGVHFNDTLDGGKEFTQANPTVAHTLVGGAGNDVYHIRHRDDVVIEDKANGGTADEAWVFIGGLTTDEKNALENKLKNQMNVEFVHFDKTDPEGDTPPPPPPPPPPSNNAPRDIRLDGKINVEVDEGVIWMGEVTAIEDDIGQTLTYEIDETVGDGGLFELVNNQDGLRLQTTVAGGIDYESAGADEAYDVTVVVTDSSGASNASTRQTFKIDVNNLDGDTTGNVAPSGVKLFTDKTPQGGTTVEVEETARKIGYFASALDADGGQHTYSIAAGGNPDGIFRLGRGGPGDANGDRWYLFVDEDKQLDYDRDQYIIPIEVRDGHNVTTQEIVLNLVEGNHEEGNNPPYDLRLENGFEVTVDENVEVIGGLSAKDPEDDQLTYHLVDNPDGLFTIVPSAVDGSDVDGYQVRVADGKVLDYEALVNDGEAVRTIEVVVEDGHGNAVFETFEINVHDLLEPPTPPGQPRNKDPENVKLAGQDTKVEVLDSVRNLGLLTAIGPEQGDIISFKLAKDGSADGIFDIDVDSAGNHFLVVADGRSMSWAQRPDGAKFYTAIVEARDNFGNVATKTFRVDVTEDPATSNNKAPYDLLLNNDPDFTVDVDENVKALGLLTAKDDDGSPQALRYRVVSSTEDARSKDASYFEVVGTPQDGFQLRATADLDADRAAGNTYDVVVEVNDQRVKNNTFRQKFSIVVKDDGPGGGEEDDTGNPKPSQVLLDGKDGPRSVLENSVDLGLLTAVNAPDGEGVTFRLANGGNASGVFYIDPATKHLMAVEKALDWEARPNGQKYFIATVEAKDDAGNITTKDFQIDVENVEDGDGGGGGGGNHAPHNLLLNNQEETVEVDENVSMVGLLTADDEDAGDEDLLTYTILGGEDGSLFKIVGDREDGFKLSSKSSNGLDADLPNGKAEYKVNIQVSDTHQGGTLTKQFTIKVEDDGVGGGEEDDPNNLDPTNIRLAGELYGVTVNENTVELGELTADAPELGEAVSIRLANGGDAEGVFKPIEVRNGKYYLVANANALDFEDLSEGHKYHTVTVEAKDAVGNITTKDFRINVKNVVGNPPDPNDNPDYPGPGNHSPYNLLLEGATTVTVDENVEVLGEVEAQDDDEADKGNLTYSIVAGLDSAFFEVVETGSGEFQLRVLNDHLDADGPNGKSEYRVTVEASDRHEGGTVQETFTIKVRNAPNDGQTGTNPPSNIMLTNADGVASGEETRDIPENLQYIGQLSATDVDPDDIVRFELALGGDGDGAFFIDRRVAGDGTVTYHLAAHQWALDYEKQPVFVASVQAHDEQGHITTKHFTFNLEDLTNDEGDNNDDEGGNHVATDIGLGNDAVLELQSGQLIGLLSNNDEDDDTFTYRIKVGEGDDATYVADNGVFKIGGANGDELLVSNASRFDFEGENPLGVTIQVDDGEGGITEKFFTIAIIDWEAEDTSTALALGELDGNNEIIGGFGDDNLNGGLGSDTLWGGFGLDTLDGGANVDGQDPTADFYVFHVPATIYDKDVIQSFDVGFDKIKLSAEQFGILGTEFNESHFYKVGSGVLGVTDRIIYNPNTGKVSFDPDGSRKTDGVSATAIELFTFGEGLRPDLTINDFLLF
jgi:Ca2+-binding RTX toxin-like protein